MSEFKKIDETLDNAELVCTKTHGTKYDFNRCLFPLKVITRIHNYEITLDEAINYQTKLRILIKKLNNDYNPRIPKKEKEKNNVLESARKLLDVRKDIIVFLKKELSRIKVIYLKQTKNNQKKNQKMNQKKKGSKNWSNILRMKWKDINYELFKKHCKFVVPSAFVIKLYEIKNKNKNNRLVNEIKGGLDDLKDKTKEMSEDEIENEKPDKILEIVEKILEFNEHQSGRGLKILTPNQMLSRLPISLAQLKAGNNSEKLKNEIRQLLYSLYRSKKLTKQLYKSLIDII